MSGSAGVCIWNCSALVRAMNREKFRFDLDWSDVQTHDLTVYFGGAPNAEKVVSHFLYAAIVMENLSWSFQPKCATLKQPILHLCNFPSFHVVVQKYAGI